MIFFRAVFFYFILFFVATVVLLFYRLLFTQIFIHQTFTEALLCAVCSARLDSREVSGERDTQN